MHNCILTGWQVLFPLIQHRPEKLCDSSGDLASEKNGTSICTLPMEVAFEIRNKGSCNFYYGRNLMKEMMLVYDGDQHRYAQIAGHGFRILAEAMEKDLPYEIKCPSLLICGTKDHAGSCIRYNREWHRKTKIPLKWIEGAGHNSNTDKPEMINSLIEEFLSNI